MSGQSSVPPQLVWGSQEERLLSALGVGSTILSAAPSPGTAKVQHRDGIDGKACSTGTDAPVETQMSQDENMYVARLEHIAHSFLSQQWPMPWSALHFYDQYPAQLNGSPVVPVLVQDKRFLANAGNSTVCHAQNFVPVTHGWNSWQWTPGALQQVSTTLDFYFSDSNLSCDTYLRNLMSPEGWVSISLLLTFPRMQVLRVDAWALRQAVMRSAMLELDSKVSYARIRERCRRERWVKARASQKCSPQSRA